MNRLFRLVLQHFYSMKLFIVPLVLFGVSIVTAEETGGHEAASGALVANALKSAKFSHVVLSYEMKVALLCALAVVVVVAAYIYFRQPIRQIVALLQQTAEEERKKEEEKAPAMDPDAQEDYEQSVALTRKEQDVAIAYAAQGEHVQAADSYIKAAVGCKRQAHILFDQKHTLSAIKVFIKCDALYEAASEQATLAGSNAGLDHSGIRGGRFATQLAAAQGYVQLASEHAAASRQTEAKEMHQAAAKQYEASVGSAVAIGNHRWAATSCAKAADVYVVLGDTGKEKEMRWAEARAYETDAGGKMAKSSNAWAAYSYIKAADLYDVVGDASKAREMRAAAARQYEAKACDELAQGACKEAAKYYFKAAALYKILGDIGMVRDMNTAAAKCHPSVQGGEDEPFV